ncbi:ThiF family adenylyltransferase [Reinekea sp. G2M2-21]|uniref:ThiF family adenylyltransferase n=1 Tax=Reinekea sp. G2M2-21 TaxID=2788942 RepID=UPI0018ABC9B5|nr:ThiF family adenylyltransferase [Reinekea sp. G2M2-21]
MKQTWSADSAFARNRGLISHEEQRQLARSLAVIPGCGGIGSTVAETLTRLGIGRFRLCDPDTFDIANFNRQLGATTFSVGQNKAAATKARILSINPDAEVDIFEQPVTASNADEFVSGADVVLDGIDFFVLNARRALFQAAQLEGVPAMTAAPLGFSATLQVYLPDQGMSFDDFFDFRDSEGSADQLVKFLVGLAPRALQRPYMDLSFIDSESQSGPSSILGTQIAAAMIGGEVVRLLLQRGDSLPAPWYRQFDVFRQRWVKSYLIGGNRHPIQKYKIRKTKQAFKQNGLWSGLSQLSLG